MSKARLTLGLNRLGAIASSLFALHLAGGCGTAEQPAPVHPDSVKEAAPPDTVATSEAPPDVTSSPASSVQGTVGGRALDVRSAVFLWREAADDMQLVFSNSDALCDALSAGAMPRDATLLIATLKHNTRENQDAPFQRGEYPVRTAESVSPQDTKRATFMTLNGSCSPVEQARATGGTITLTSPEARPGATLEGQLELEMEGGEHLQGRFTATYCRPSDEEPRGCLR